MAYPEGLLSSGERVREHLRPHVRMLVVPAVVPPLVAGVGMWLAALVARQSWHSDVWTWAAWIALVVLGVVIVGRWALTPLLSWWCTHLVVTDRRLLVREGVLSRSGVDVAARTITDVRTGQRGLERLLGCGTLLVGTRDTPGEPWEFHGIPHLAHTAARLGAVAEERGGLREPEPFDADDDELLDEDLPDEDLPDDKLVDDDLADDQRDDEPIEAELVEDDEDDEVSHRSPRRAWRSADRTSR